MKKILILVGLLILLTSTECEDKKAETRTNTYTIYVDTVFEHEYIIVEALHAIDMEHSASCPCKKGGRQ